MISWFIISFGSLYSFIYKKYFDYIFIFQISCNLDVTHNTYHAQWKRWFDATKLWNFASNLTLFIFFLRIYLRKMREDQFFAFKIKIKMMMFGCWQYHRKQNKGTWQCDVIWSWLQLLRYKMCLFVYFHLYIFFFYKLIDLCKKTSLQFLYLISDVMLAYLNILLKREKRKIDYDCLRSNLSFILIN